MSSHWQFYALCESIFAKIHLIGVLRGPKQTSVDVDVFMC